MACMIMGSRSSAFQTLRSIARTSPATLRRALSTLPSNPHIYIHPDPTSSSPKYTLAYLPTTPPNPSLAIGHSTTSPPTPDTFTPNPAFLDLLHTILAEHAASDPEVQAQAQVYLSSAGSTLGSGGAFFPRSNAASSSSRSGFRNRRSSTISQSQSQSSSPSSAQHSSVTSTAGGGSDGSGGASAQGGSGGGGRGGWIHVADQRNPPDWGRVAWPEDIFGSVEIDAKGEFVDGTGRYQRSGTYRVVTREGVLGLSGYLRERVVERLRELEKKS